MRTGLQVVELRHLLRRECAAVAGHAARFVLRFAKHRRVALQQVDHPGQRVGGGVFTGEQHGQHVARHVTVSQLWSPHGRSRSLPPAGERTSGRGTRPRFGLPVGVTAVGGRDHRFEQIARLRVQQWVDSHAFAGLRDEAFDRGVDGHCAAFQRAVGWQPDVAPVRKLRQDAPKDRREDLVEVALNDFFDRLQRVHLGAEGQARNRVDGVAHQVGLQVDRLLGPRRLLPAAAQTLGDLQQRRKVVFHVLGVEARHDHAALALPTVALGTEDAARHAHFVPDLAQPRGAPVTVRAVAQHLADHLVVGQHQELSAAQAEAENRPELAAPLLDAGMHTGAVDLRQVAQQWQAARAGKVGNLAQAFAA